MRYGRKEGGQAVTDAHFLRQKVSRTYIHIDGRWYITLRQTVLQHADRAAHYDTLHKITSPWLVGQLRIHRIMIIEQFGSALSIGSASKNETSSGHLRRSRRQTIMNELLRLTQLVTSLCFKIYSVF